MHLLGFHAYKAFVLSIITLSDRKEFFFSLTGDERYLMPKYPSRYLFIYLLAGAIHYPNLHIILPYYLRPFSSTLRASVWMTLWVLINLSSLRHGYNSSFHGHRLLVPLCKWMEEHTFLMSYTKRRLLYI